MNIRWKFFIVNFLFKIFTCVKCNYLWSHLQVRLDVANGIVTLFFYFSHIWASGSSVPLSTLPSSSIWFNLMTNFSGTRLLEFHWSGYWNFKTLCIHLLRVWIRLDCIFGLWDTSAMDFKEKNTEKKTFKKSFLTNWKLILIRESPLCIARVWVCLSRDTNKTFLFLKIKLW